MTEVPSMWRVELLHPLVAHFPIALLLTGSVVWLTAWAAGAGAGGRWSFLTPAGRLILWLGLPLAWLAVYSGLLANAEVARSLCDPTVKRLHEELAYATASVFTGAVAVDLALWLGPSPARLRLVGRILVALALATGVALLVYTGHLGSRLVYQQGAAVHHPSERCTEFE